jgi:hypothetical protein
VGKGIEWVVNNKPEVTGGATFIFLSSKDADLRDEASTLACFKKHNPTHVIHLAARVVRRHSPCHARVLDASLCDPPPPPSPALPLQTQSHWEKWRRSDGPEAHVVPGQMHLLQ